MIEKIFAGDGTLAYEGEALYGKPYGIGTVYWPVGQARQQGIFDIKGLAEGKLCYPDGQRVLKGNWVYAMGMVSIIRTKAVCIMNKASLFIKESFMSALAA